MIKITRCWSMPNKWTFTIKPIRELVYRYVGDGKRWADPFAGKNSPAEFTNDLNPEMPTDYHLEAEEFAKLLKEKDIKLKGCLFDPPYSLTQISRSYKGIGKEYHNENDRTGSFTKTRDILASLIEEKGIVMLLVKREDLRLLRFYLLHTGVIEMILSLR